LSAISLPTTYDYIIYVDQDFFYRGQKANGDPLTNPDGSELRDQTTDPLGSSRHPERIIQAAIDQTNVPNNIYVKSAEYDLSNDANFMVLR
jgi:hypothetical protein